MLDYHDLPAVLLSDLVAFNIGEPLIDRLVELGTRLSVQ